MPHSYNNDQDSHITNPQYLDQFLAIQVKISMDDRGCARGGIFTERLCRTVKYEEVYIHKYANPKDVYRGLSLYIYFYDNEHPHQTLVYQTTAQDYSASLPVVNST